MIAGLVALGLSAATGWCLLHPSPDVARLPLSMRVSLAIGLGLAASALITFAALALGVATLPVLVALDLLLLAGAGVLFARKRSERSRLEPTARATGGLWLGAVAGAGSIQLAASFARYRSEPLGFWDAFAIWNLKARFFHLEGGAHWQRAFSETITWSHTDYPLLLPSGVARLWAYAGEPSTALSATYSLLFLLLTIALVYGALEKLADARIAALGALALLATPAFVGQGTWQVADIPLSFALLSTLALLLFAREASPPLARLAGVFAGLGALTKNEGLLFAAAILVVLFVAERRSGLWKTYAQGAALPIAILLAMKLGTGGESDLASDFGLHSLARTIEVERHVAIVLSFARTLLTLAGWPLLVVLIGGGVVMRASAGAGLANGVRLAALALAIQLLGYYGVYLITERDLAWHLGTSNLRLFVQLWPSVVLLYFACFFAGAGGEGGDRGEEGGANQASSRLA